MNNSGFFFMTISTSKLANFFDKFSSMRRVFSKIVDGISWGPTRFILLIAVTGQSKDQSG